MQHVYILLHVLFAVLLSGVVHHLSLQMDDPAPLLCVLHHMLITECNMFALYYMCVIRCAAFRCGASHVPSNGRPRPTAVCAAPHAGH